MFFVNSALYLLISTAITKSFYFANSIVFPPTPQHASNTILHLLDLFAVYYATIYGVKVNYESKSILRPLSIIDYIS